jgi:hypothetical protein
VPGVVSVTVKVWPAVIISGEFWTDAPEGTVCHVTLWGAPDWLSWSTKVTVVPGATLRVEGWKLRDWSLPTFCGITTVTAPEDADEVEDAALEDELVVVVELLLLLLLLDGTEVLVVVDVGELVVELVCVVLEDDGMVVLLLDEERDDEVVTDEEMLEVAVVDEEEEGADDDDADDEEDVVPTV